MLLLLSQQWMKALNIRHEIWAVSLDIPRAFDTLWHPTLLSKLFVDGIQWIVLLQWGTSGNMNLYYPIGVQVVIYTCISPVGYKW